MPGLEDDDDWDDDFRPAPHPDDRLWRHPAEIAAEAQAAARASAETLEVPTLLPPEPRAPQPRLRLVAFAALSALLVGGTAVLAGTLSQPDTASDAFQADAQQPVADAAQQAASQARTQASADGVQPVVAAVSQGQALASLEATLHAELAGSLPKIQVVTDDGMVEGSGFFLTASGHIATSSRLLHSSEYVIVWTNGNQRFRAEIMGSDTFSDVALIKIESSQWHPVDVAEDAALHLGQPTLALDHGQGVMLSSHVSSPFGTIRSDGQPSAPRVLISENSPAGSAIVDETGAIIAMSNGLIDSSSGKAIATPAWLIERVALDMLVSGNSSHAWLGAEVAETGDDRAITITEVQAASPAHQAGLQVGDEIEQIDGNQIASLETLMRDIYTHNPGDQIDVMIARDDSRRVVVVTLGSLFD